MENQDNRVSATEQVSPEISVCAHIQQTTKLKVETVSDAPCLNFMGWAYPSVVVFFPDRAKLSELRSTIDAYLDATA